MKKLVLLAAILAMVTSVAVPAIAQVAQEAGQETESGGVELGFEVANEADFGGQCTPGLQSGTSGNLQSGNAGL